MLLGEKRRGEGSPQAPGRVLDNWWPSGRRALGVGWPRRGVVASVALSHGGGRRGHRARTRWPVGRSRIQTVDRRVAQRNFSTPHAPVGIQAVINTGAREEIAGTCGPPPSSRAPVNDVPLAQPPRPTAHGPRPTDVSAAAGAAEEATETHKIENGVCTVHMRRDDRDKEYNALHPARLIRARTAGRRCNGQLLKVERERIGERRRNFSVPRL